MSMPNGFLNHTTTSCSRGPFSAVQENSLIRQFLNFISYKTIDTHKIGTFNSNAGQSYYSEFLTQEFRIEGLACKNRMQATGTESEK